MSAEQIAHAARGARRAACVIVLRDSPAGPEVLMLRRAEREGDPRSGIWVFPGGVLDAEDPDLHPLCDGPDDVELSERMALPSGGLAYAVAAVRECFEEVGLLYAHGQPGVVADVLEERTVAHAAGSFGQLMARNGLRLALNQLHYWAHWLTPPGVSKRFDTRFFVARAPAGQAPQVDQGEVLELAWMTPLAALNPGAHLKLLPVTRRTLQDLGRFASVQACLDDAAQRWQPPCQMSRVGRDARGVARPVAQDEWAWAEISRLDPDGARGDVCHELVPSQVVRLSPRVARITCHNGSVMTGPGTNTYVVMSPGSDDAVVIDPGPDDAHTEAHLLTVLEAAQAMGARRVRHILVTHTHRDHSPAAQRLKALTKATLVGRRCDHLSGQDLDFVPDQVPQDGERLWLGPDASLVAVATPGHASNHVCWYLEQERLLFTGDHVMQSSTVIINPPDGQMAAYLASLERLLALPLDWLAPGHGFLMASPHVEVRRLIAHRLAREAKVLDALHRLGGIERAPNLVPLVYGDVPDTRHGLALRSLTAHLLKLKADGAVEEVGERWRVLRA